MATRLTKIQRQALQAIHQKLHMQGTQRSRTLTLGVLRKRGLIMSQGTGFGYGLTPAGREALGLKDENQLKDRLHYTVSTGTSRLCGAPASEWGTVAVPEVTCSECKAKLAEQVKISDEVVAEVIKEEQQEASIGTLATAPNRSWKPEVIADGSGQWCGNALRFATKEEAEANVRDLFGRWAMVRETRVVESADEVNYQWDVERGLVPCRLTPTSAYLAQEA